ncbi:Bug family tripartite tricarboxylate transporter substrate binding protein [Dankookia sp. P2]|uniref:Bug family tripartite tricarboxylate transporter substrate binding protein n=1 Tax=Dankookia sp. P2 TaxID=3423955 RepID=UPI003D6749F3
MRQQSRRALLRRVTLAALVATGTALAGPAYAAEDAFPAHEIRFLNGFAPGGTSDLVGRILADQLSRQLGQRVVVDNRTGGGGAVAAQELVRSAPDGHTLLLGSTGILAIAPQMQALSYDVDRDMVPIANVASAYNILITGPRSEVRTWQDLARFGQDPSRRLTCATVGAGSSQQLACVLFASLTGVRIEQVPYRGGAPAILDIASGQVDVMFGNMPEFLGQIRDGGLRPVGYGTAEPSPLLPDVPVISRTGLPGFVVPGSWFGVVGPRRMPQALVARWNAEITQALADPAVQRRLAENGLRRLGGSSEEFERQIATDRASWGEIIRRHNITPD